MSAILVPLVSKTCRWLDMLKPACGLLDRLREPVGEERREHDTPDLVVHGLNWTPGIVRPINSSTRGVTASGPVQAVRGERRGLPPPSSLARVDQGLKPLARSV